jgi:uncharacterized protein (TIGR03086 family)
MIEPMNPGDRTPDIGRLIDAGRDREAAVEGVRSTSTAGGTMDPITQLEQLGPQLDGVVAGITPDQLDNPTPCDDFTVRGVLEHMIGGATVFAAAYRGEAPTDPDLSDLLSDFESVIGDLFAAISAPGALDQTVAAPFGEVPAETFARFVVLDGLVHGYDMATATGQPYTPPAELVAAADAFAHQTLDPLRDGQTFAAATEPGPDASPIERLAAYTGRQT